MDSGAIRNACYLSTSSLVDIVTRQGTERTGVQIPAGDFPPLTPLILAVGPAQLPI